ncbi:MAG TPA: TetR/AcrR family transcriptional regulator [Aridibacter sp.]|nr:TetR/AcrR family transcriptional regulator [Aridibacter sp.]
MRASVQTKEVRDAILDATDLLLSRYGYKKMTIDDLAREVGIGKGSVYLHFSSKEEIVLSHIDRIVDRVKKDLEKIAARKAPPEEKLREMVLSRVLIRFDNVQHYTESIDEILSSLRAKVIERRKQYFREEAEIFAKVIREGQESGEFAKGDADEFARVIITSTNSLLPAGLSTQELGERSHVRKKALAICGLLLKGLTNT